MSTTIHSPASLPEAASAAPVSSSASGSAPGPARLGAPRSHTWSGEPGLLALALGLLALTCSLHPVWSLAAVGLAPAATALGALALGRPSEWRLGAIGAASALLALVVASVTVPATARAAAAVLGWLLGLRAGG